MLDTETLNFCTSIMSKSFSSSLFYFCAGTTGMIAGMSLYNYFNKKTEKEVTRQPDKKVQEEKVTEEVSLLEGYSHQGQVIWINSDDDWHCCLETIKRDIKIFKVLAFHCDWLLMGKESGPTRPIALLKIISAYNRCWFIKLNHVSPIPDQFKRIMSDASILKVASAALEEAAKLRRYHSLCFRGCVDLRCLALKHSYLLGDQLIGPEFSLKSLSDVTEYVLGKKLKKSTVLITNDKNSHHLKNLDQKLVQPSYPAFASMDIFLSLLRLKYPKSFVEIAMSREKWMKALLLCCGLVEVSFLSYTEGKEKEGKGDTVKKIANSSCKCEYRDLELTLPLLCEEVNSNNNHGCVSCGTMDLLKPKQVLPPEYVRHIPNRFDYEFKFLYFCRLCYLLACEKDDLFRTELAKECSAPDAYFIPTHPLKLRIRSAAVMLLSLRNAKLSSYNENLTNFIKRCYLVPNLSNGFLKALGRININLLNPEHSEKVMEYILCHSSITEFEKRWTCFLEKSLPLNVP